MREIVQQAAGVRNTLIFHRTDQGYLLSVYDKMLNMRMIDATDARILLALDAEPQATVLSISRELGIARNTVHARLGRLLTDGSLGPQSQRVRNEALGLPLAAFVSVATSQSATEETVAALCMIPEIIEMHATTGDADLMAKVAAKNPADLLRITNQILSVDGVVRTSTTMSLLEVLPPRILPLLKAVAQIKA